MLLTAKLELWEEGTRGLRRQWTRPDPDGCYIPCDRYGRTLQPERNKNEGVQKKNKK